LESAHAVWEGIRLAKQRDFRDLIVICLSGRGDKDVETIRRALRGEP
jgi:tryptophan synthase beta subunit